jgi:hypothetical protein
MRYNSAGSETGNDRSMTAWIIVKIAVVPPIPNASVNVAAAVNIGDIRNCRKVYRRVLLKFCKRIPPSYYQVQTDGVPG